MKKVSMWLVAAMTCLVSLIAMCIFDFILSVIYYFIGKVPFLSDIIDYIGGLLDLGLTVLIAMGIATAIWRFGHSIIEKINGNGIEFQKSPIYYINNCFLFIFLAMVLFLGYKFVMLIGGAVTEYTAALQGMDKILMFLKAIKDTVALVCNENILLYKIGNNALILFAINIYADRFID